jgi:hypothetical protein
MNASDMTRFLKVIGLGSMFRGLLLLPIVGLLAVGLSYTLWHLIKSARGQFGRGACAEAPRELPFFRGV